MSPLKTSGLWPSGRNFRRIGLMTMCWSVATAAMVGDTWVASFLIGAWLIGVGCGLGDWEMEERGRR